MRDSVKWDVAMVEEGGETERGGGGRNECRRRCDNGRMEAWMYMAMEGVGGRGGGGSGGENKKKKTALMWKIWGLDRR